MPTRTTREIVDAARARFDDGEHRAAWDSLLVHARRHPDERAYRDALSEFYRRAGNPDQAARWGAHDLASLDARERHALRRSLLQFETEKEVRDYLVLSGGLPPETTEHLGSPRQQRLIRWEPTSELLLFIAGLSGVIGVVFVMTLLVCVVVTAFTGDPETQSVAQVFVSVALGVVAGAGALASAGYLLSERWWRGGLLGVVAVAAAVVLAQTDITSPLPFG
jgi:hypothetical protein